MYIPPPYRGRMRYTSLIIDLRAVFGEVSPNEIRFLQREKRVSVKNISNVVIDSIIMAYLNSWYCSIIWWRDIITWSFIFCFPINIFTMLRLQLYSFIPCIDMYIPRVVIICIILECANCYYWSIFTCQRYRYPNWSSSDFTINSFTTFNLHLCHKT